MPGSFPIGVLAKRTGTKVQTIRFYEERGLLPAPPRTEGGQRRYDSQHLHQLSFIRHGRELGFSLEMIADLMRLARHPDDPCASADKIARAHLAEVEIRLGRLERLRDALLHMTENCDGQSVSSCKVLETLSDDSPTG